MRKKKMILLLIIFALIVLVILWFNIPYSPFRNQFKKDLNKQIQLSESFLQESSKTVYAKEDFESLFNSLYDNIKVTFTEMIFLFEKFTKLYQNFIDIFA